MAQQAADKGSSPKDLIDLFDFKTYITFKLQSSDQETLVNIFEGVEDSFDKIVERAKELYSSYIEALFTKI